MSRTPTIEQLNLIAHQANWAQAKLVYADEIEQLMARERIDELENVVRFANEYVEERIKELSDSGEPGDASA